MKAIGVLPSVVLLIGLFCILFVLVESGRKNTSKTRSRGRRKTKLGVIDPDTGIVRVGEKLMTPAQAKRSGIQIAGYYEPPKKRKKSLLKPY